MIDGGSVTIYVSDMERAVRFYTETLGLHATHPGGPRPGQVGGTQLGFNVARPIEEVVGELRRHGVEVDGPRPGGGPIMLAFFADPDGNPLHLVEERRS